MTAFNKSQMPDAINTLEEVLVWCASILAELTAGQTVAIDRSNTARIIDARPALLEQALTDPERFAVVAYLPLEPTWRRKKAWNNGIKEVTTESIPPDYSLNS
jgi:hypothetical protein